MHHGGRKVAQVACSRLSQFQLEIDSDAGKFICKRDLEATTIVSRGKICFTRTLWIGRLRSNIVSPSSSIIFLWKKANKFHVETRFYWKNYTFDISTYYINFNYIWVTKYCIHNRMIFRIFHVLKFCDIDRQMINIFICYYLLFSWKYIHILSILLEIPFQVAKL